MAPLAGRLLFATLAATFVAAPLLASNEAPAASAGVATREQPPKLIVMNDGTLAEGPFRVVPSGYEYVSRAGRVLIGKPFIWFTAENRLEAYHKLRDRISFAKAEHHYWLADWCVRYGLRDEGRNELVRALELDPRHAASLALLKRVGAPRSQQPVEMPAPEPAAPHHETLGGLPPETARMFVSRVQPILVNKCANGSCHGALTTSAFSLKNVRLGSPAYKTHTHENLAAVLEQISLDDPTSSPLVVQPQQPGHGGSRKALFAGPAGAAQQQQIIRWITAVSRSNVVPARSSDGTDGGELQLTSGVLDEASASPFAVPAGEGAGEPGTATGNEMPVGPTEPAAAGDEAARLLEQINRNDRPDAFDPAAFNRQFAPRTESDASPSLKGPQQ